MANGKKKALAKIIAGRLSAMGPEQIDAVRSTKGEIKGFFTKDTLYRLRQAVADHKKSGEEGADARLAIILGLCDIYIARHGAETDGRAREKVAPVEDIKAEAMTERDRRQAMDIYVQDAYAGADEEEERQTALVQESHTAVTFAVSETQALAKGKVGKKEGFNQATLNLIQKYDLTEAEILAVKIYSADDYHYINPATANSETYMENMNFKGKRWDALRREGSPKDYLESDEGRRHLKELFEEGSVHGALAISALQKLPPMVGMCYRGDRMTPGRFRGEIRRCRKSQATEADVVQLDQHRYRTVGRSEVRG